MSLSLESLMGRNPQTHFVRQAIQPLLDFRYIRHDLVHVLDVGCGQAITQLQLCLQLSQPTTRVPHGRQSQDNRDD
jgi:hypothetical protein